MMGIKERNFSPLPRDISLEDLVPKDNFYRRLESDLDLSFVREMVASLYSGIGRPSVDPQVFFRLQLVMFFEDIRSERELMRVAADRLSVRWYLGYDLHERLPFHSSLTRARERFGVGIFREFFDEIVQRCIEAGLVWGGGVLLRLHQGQGRCRHRQPLFESNLRKPSGRSLRRGRLRGQQARGGPTNDGDERIPGRHSVRLSHLRRPDTTGGERFTYGLDLR